MTYPAHSPRVYSIDLFSEQFETLRKESSRVWTQATDDCHGCATMWRVNDALSQLTEHRQEALQCFVKFQPERLFAVKSLMNLS